jgi:two-component system, cell cycle sensor histidine kinase and response regulator CckA
MTGESKTDRIDRMIDAVMKAAKGDYSVRIDTSDRNDGLDALAGAINAMMDRVQEEVAEGRQAKEALRKSEESYRRLKANIPGMVYQFILHRDGSHVFPYVSTECRQLFGIEAEDLMRDGNLLADLIHPDDKTRRDESIRRSAETFQLWREELRHIVRGEVRWYDCMSRPEIQPNGEILWDGIMMEITGHKEAEEALRKSEAKYRRLHETMMDAFVSVDMALHIQETNRAYRVMLGYPEEELRRLTYKELTPEKWHDFEKRIVKEEVLVHGHSQVYEKEYRRKDGTVFPVELRTFLMRDETGRPEGMWAIVRDITARKQAEGQLDRNLRQARVRFDVSQALAATETEDEVLDALIQHAGLDPQGFVSILVLDRSADDPTAVQCRVDPFESGLVPKVAIGTRFPASRYPTVRLHSAHRPFVANDLLADERIDPASMERMRQLGAGSRASFPLTTGNEWMGYISVFAKPTGYFDEDKITLYQTLADQGAVALRAARLREAIRESQQRLSLLVEQSPLAVIEWNTDFRVVSWNPAAERIFGYTREEAVGCGLAELVVPEEERLPVKEAWQDVLAKKRDAHSHSIKDNLTKAGRLITCEWFNAPLVGADGSVIGLASLVQDVTERKLAEEENARLQSQLLQAHKMESVGRLAGGVAHDFNNMLSVILGYTELIKSRLSSHDPLLIDLSTIERAANHSKDITRQLLAFSRSQIIAPKPVNLNDLIGDTQKTLAPLIGEDIDLRFHPAKDLWKIKFDRSQIDQILVNMAVNARDAMPEGGKLTVETANVQLDEVFCGTHLGFVPGDYVLLTMSDSGVGMDKETLSHVFEPFYSTKEVGKGTGLGLATVYGIVKQNGGFINVYSEPGEGTVFKIYIPRIIVEDEAPEKAEEAPVAYGAGTILLVEDDDMVRRITTTMLEAIGYTVLAAETPQDALSLGEDRDRPIDLLITDVVMPGMSGPGLRDRMEAIRPGIKVLFMSGYTSNAIVHRGVLEEGVYFIQKPFSIKALAEKVRDAMGGGRRG